MCQRLSVGLNFFLDSYDSKNAADAIYDTEGNVLAQY